MCDHGSRCQPPVRRKQAPADPRWETALPESTGSRSSGCFFSGGSRHRLSAYGRTGSGHGFCRHLQRSAGKRCQSDHPSGTGIHARLRRRPVYDGRSAPPDPERHTDRSGYFFIRTGLHRRRSRRRDPGQSLPVPEMPLPRPAGIGRRHRRQPGHPGQHPPASADGTAPKGAGRCRHGGRPAGTGNLFFRRKSCIMNKNKQKGGSSHVSALGR